MNQIEIINETEEKIEELKTVEELMDYATSYQKLENAIFNIIIIDNDRIQKMNLEYRGIDRPTDVISFALEDYEDEIVVDGMPRVLGDIYISIDKAKEQAVQYGHSLKRELCFLSVHGLLHLLGYDHMNEEDEKEMFGRQELILNGFGIKRQ